MVQLEKINHADRFPKEFKTQYYITRSLLTAANDYNKLDSIVFLSKQFSSVKDQKGLVYFYKYRIKSGDQWKIAITGFQPFDETQIKASDNFSVMTDVRLKDDEPLGDQLDEQLKKTLFTFHKSAKNFYRNTYGNNGQIKF